MKSLFVKQLMEFCRANEISIKWIATVLQGIRRGRGKNKITTKTVYGWLESEKKLLKIDQKVMDALIDLETSLPKHSPQAYMPDPWLSDALMTDVINHMMEKGEVVEHEDGIYSLSEGKPKRATKNRKTNSRTKHNKSRSNA